MKSKCFLLTGFVTIILFIIVATYFWYNYFLDFNNDGKINHNGNSQGKIVLVNIKEVNKTNAEINTNIDDNPSYIFKIDNRKTSSTKYALYLESIPYNKMDDGCTLENTFQLSELNYELKLNNQIIKTGLLSNLNNNLLDERSINIDVSNYYDLKIWINSETKNWKGKHYHYKVLLEEIS